MFAVHLLRRLTVEFPLSNFHSGYAHRVARWIFIVFEQQLSKDRSLTDFYSEGIESILWIQRKVAICRLGAAHRVAYAVMILDLRAGEVTFQSQNNASRDFILQS